MSLETLSAVFERRRAAVAAVLGARRRGVPVRTEGRAFAPANIALCKYWGKRDRVLNLPVTSSVSISLGPLGTHMLVRLAERDHFWLNGAVMDRETPEARRLADYLDLFRSEQAPAFEVRSHNTLPTAAGLASSASAFAALARALDMVFGWGLDATGLSILARLGSGSAARSVAEGFVEWRAGARDDGADSHAVLWPEKWPELRVGLLVVSNIPKPIGSREAMQRTVESSPLYGCWPAMAERDLSDIRAAVRARDFEWLGQVAEANAMAMHATMLAARPAIRFWRPETVEWLDRLEAFRRGGGSAYATLDAGPNLKLLFLASEEKRIRESFPDVQVVAPFLPCKISAPESL